MQQAAQSLRVAYFYNPEINEINQIKLSNQMLFYVYETLSAQKYNVMESAISDWVQTSRVNFQ